MEHILKNGIDILYKNSKNTPRSAVCFYFGIDTPEKISGTYGLFAKLLLQGTKTKTAAQLAQELENNCIDVSIKAKQDYLKISFLFLNEDFELAMQYAKDIMLNPTFCDFEKEIFKMKGEIKAELDNPRIKASDMFVRTLFGSHYYSHTCTKVLEDADTITKQDILDTHKQILNSRKVISFAGDIKDADWLTDFFAQNFDFMKSNNSVSQIETVSDFIPKEGNVEIVKISKDDLNQAQVFSGCIVPTTGSDFYAKISVMNNILGASGLSSRLFVELRDKQGLAYTVRSSYETLHKSAVFSFYIATEPKNIRKSLDGFMDELEKLTKIPATEEELSGAKENILGKIEYFTQTNSQIASMEGYNYLMGLGLNYSDKFAQMINKINSTDVSKAAELILNKKSLICALAPGKYLNF